MAGVGRAEAEGFEVEPFEDGEHLADMDAGGGRGRRAEDVPAAIGDADGFADARLIGGEVRHGDEAAGGRHVLRHRLTKRAAVQSPLAFPRDQSQRVGVVALHQAFAGLERGTTRQIAIGDQLVLEEVGRRGGDAIMQIGRDREAARGVADGGFHHVGQRHGAEAPQRHAPRQQRPRRRDRFGADDILLADRLVVLGGPPRHRAIHRRMPAKRHGGHAVDDGVGAVGGADMGGAAADQPDHHRFHHGEGELHRHRRVNRVAAGGQHFRPGRGCQRVVAGDHAAAAHGRLLLSG